MEAMVPLYNLKLEVIKMKDEKLSKMISHALRHKPEDYNLKLSKDGWVPIDELARSIKVKAIGHSTLTVEDIINLVSAETKKRHEIKDGQIRALHGHSLEIEIENQPLIPPAKLFHATASNYWDKIKKEGLHKMKRNYVHLSTNKQGAVEIAAKKYKGILLLQVEALKASENGVLFYSNNRDLIWLCKHIQPQYISIIIE
jgi:putative RNA 2'-phosphotransferase